MLAIFRPLPSQAFSQRILAQLWEQHDNMSSQLNHVSGLADPHYSVAVVPLGGAIGLPYTRRSVVGA